MASNDGYSDVSRPAGARARVAVFGAAPDTPNMGVSALFECIVGGLTSRFADLELVVFDNGSSLRWVEHVTAGGQSVPVLRCGIRAGKRVYRSDNLLTLSLASRLGRVGSVLNRVIRLIDSCVAVVDVSGGDSFSDIYGRKRFGAIARPKRVAAARGKPVILLPQTYGPYFARVVREQAAAILRRAHQAWARDSESYEILKELLGNRFDADQHRCGVDMAFLLQPRNCKAHLTSTIREWLSAAERDKPIVGLNVSGLIYNDPTVGHRQYGFRADYVRLVQQLAAKILQSGDNRILLIPHVMSPVGHYESDYGAALSVRDALSALPNVAGRVEVVPPGLSAAESKWLIGHLDWLCATRMHAAIAGLSSGVPTAAVSYSDKTRGVFLTCEQGGSVVDPRVLDEDEAVQRLLANFAQRATVRAELSVAVPRVQEYANAQMDAIAAEIKAIIEREAPGVREPEPAAAASTPASIED